MNFYQFIQRNISPGQDYCPNDNTGELLESPPGHWNRVFNLNFCAQHIPDPLTRSCFSTARLRVTIFRDDLDGGVRLLDIEVDGNVTRAVVGPSPA